MINLNEIQLDFLLRACDLNWAVLQFDITDKDPGSPEYKKIRVVSTLRFLLK
jgi:hypothetical protein